MIAALTGTVATTDANGLIRLRCGPVTLELTLPVSQALSLQRGEEAELHTHLHLSTSADQLKLFGFTSATARDLFAILISGSGVGPKVALALLELGVPALVAAVRDGDEQALTSVSGVGPKLARKIILELGEKVGQDFAAAALAGEPLTGKTAADHEALSAVVALGYPRLKAEQGLARARAQYDGEDASELVRRILSQLAGG